MKTGIARVIFFLTTALIGGCARLPFDEGIHYQRLQNPDPEEIRNAFAESLPASFEIVESSAISARGREFDALTYTRVDSAEPSFTSVGMSSMGVTLYSIKEKDGKLEFDFSLPETFDEIEKDAMAEAMAEDLKRVYLDRVPPAAASVSVLRDRVLFETPAEGGILRYVFGGPGLRLVEKSLTAKKDTLWRARYFKYETKGNYLYPSLIYYEELTKHYAVTLRLKEIKS